MKDFWQQTVDSAREEFSDHVFNTWIKPLSYKDFKSGSVCVEVPNNVYREKVKKFYYPYLLEKYRCISENQGADISFVVSATKKPTKKPQLALVKKQPDKEKNTIASSHFSKNLTFDSFVVGNNNHLAAAAAQSIAQEPGKKFNPLLVYGGVGLGKTHLLHAIGNAFLEKHPEKSVLYRTSEEFMNDLIHSIRFEKMDAFRNRYRQCDVLLIDDIQFFSGKERTQEEFFHTFNELFKDNKQIVLTSDRLPSEIPDLDNRLRSRFQSGLFCDVQSPDLETRLAIINKKADEEGLVYQ
ncbi:MAG: chromosomal replication initiator protein DnaA [Bdellovibrionota bacterium]